MSNRVDNRTTGASGAAAAKAMLRVKHLQNEGYSPWLGLIHILEDAYPEARYTDADGAPCVDWKVIALGLAGDFVPAFQRGKAQGRPPARKDGLVEAVDRLVETGEAGNLKHAFGIVDQRGLFPGVSDAKSAYYRRKSLR